jgi:hypothetical protein
VTNVKLNQMSNKRRSTSNDPFVSNITGTSEQFNSYNFDEASTIKCIRVEDDNTPSLEG